MSWVELDADVDVGDAAPVLAPEALERRVAALAAALGDSGTAPPRG